MVRSFNVYLLVALFIFPALAQAGQRYNSQTGKTDYCITVEESDGSPSNVACSKVLVTNGTLTDNGDGTFTLGTGGGGSGDVVTINSVDVDTTANFDDSADISLTLTDGGAGGPDTITAFYVAGSVGDDEIANSPTITGTITTDGLTMGDSERITQGDLHMLTVSGVTQFGHVTNGNYPLSLDLNVNQAVFEGSADFQGSIHTTLNGGECVETNGDGWLTTSGSACGAGGGGNSFETIAVPAGTNPVADSSTDTLTITETSPLVITGTAATDTIDITWSSVDLGADGTIQADSVALTTDTTGNYAAGDAEAGNALSGDSATAFFSSGSIEAARGGTGGDSSGSTGIARVDAGTWSYSELSGDVTTSGSNATTYAVNSIDFTEIIQSNTLAGNPALAVDECFLVATATGGGFICEGSTDNTNEQLYLFPDQDSADSTEYIVVADDANVSATEAGFLDGVGAAIVDTGDAVNTAITGTGALDAGSITSNFGAIDVGASSIAGGSFDASEGNITNVGDVQLDSLTADDGATITVNDILSFSTGQYLRWADQAHIYSADDQFSIANLATGFHGFNMNTLTGVIHLEGYDSCPNLKTVDGEVICGADNDSGGAPEGTAVLSTGETGGTKFLREDGDGTSSWQTVSGADTNAIKLFSWSAASTLPIRPLGGGSDAIAPISKDTGGATNFEILVALFDQTADECRGVTFKVPEDVDTTGTAQFHVSWYAGTATTGNVIWDFRWHEVNEAESWDAAETVDVAAADATQGTTDQFTETTWTETLSNLGWTADETVTGYFCRDGDNGSDTMADDASAVNFAVEVPRS